MSTPDDTRIPEDTALVAILTEQVGNLNTLVTRYRLRANAAEDRAQRAEERAAELQRELEVVTRARPTTTPAEPPRVIVPAPADAPVGQGEISVSLDAPPTAPADAMDAAWDELLGEVRLR